MIIPPRINPLPAKSSDIFRFTPLSCGRRGGSLSAQRHLQLVSVEQER